MNEEPAGRSQHDLTGAHVDVIDTAAAAAADAIRVNGISLSIDDNCPLLARARAAATRQAKAQAAELAEAAGAHLGRLRMITETSQAEPPPVMYAPSGPTGGAAGVAASVPIAPGTQEVR